MREGRNFYVFSRFTRVTQRITREDEVEDALPGATGRREKRTLLQL